MLHWRGRFLPPLAIDYKRAVAAFAIASLLGLAGLPHASARGGMALEDPWNPAHLEGLPRGVRASIERSTRACGAASFCGLLRYIEAPA